VALKLQFDANQQFQLDAIAAVTGLFEGQPQAAPEFSISKASSWGGLSSEGAEILGAANPALPGEDFLQHRVRHIQAHNDIDVANEKDPLEIWTLVDSVTKQPRVCPHFSVEMETGTGKTYVYLRTVFELAKLYGHRKFIVVVPSVAIREGVLQSIEQLKDHFRALYNNMEFEPFVYDGKKVNRLRHFAHANTLQLMVINIDSFRKNFAGTEDENKGNVIFKESDKLSGRQPIEFIQAVQPIVIIDEPQSVDNTDKAQEAIKALNPLMTLRYSATHRNPYNLLYRLDPVRAFQLRLVKQIYVATATSDVATGDAFVRLEGVDHKKGISAKVRIMVQGPNGAKEKSVKVDQGSDLQFLSDGRAEYEGYSVSEISAAPGDEFVRFANSRVVRLGAEVGGVRDDIWRVQIKQTIKAHLDKELRVSSRGIKVLSLFFLDRVANYREYDAEGKPSKGKLAMVFEEELQALLKDPRYADIAWRKENFERLHDGYFAQDNKGGFKDSKEGRSTAADDGAYELIMRNKQKLLDMAEPLRFIFSHSALREGWDNPNVFQICTLSESKSGMRKRQEIGRGLRLPVDQTGQRVQDDSINRLFVMANESYEDFARSLQTEYEEECGVTFGKISLRVLSKMIRTKDGIEQPAGDTAAAAVQIALREQKMLDYEGRILPAFRPGHPDFKLVIPEPFADLTAVVIDTISSFQMERHIQRARDNGQNLLKRKVMDSPEFRALWERIKPRTVYRVEFETPNLVKKAVDGIQKMPKIDRARILVGTSKVEVTKKGVQSTQLTAGQELVNLADRPIPDVLAYLQAETELTRSTLAEILGKCNRLDEFFHNPQKFLDQVAAILKDELHRLVVDGIKYERLTGPDANWEMMLFKDEELINFLTSVKVDNSIYEYVPWESDVERDFATKIDKRDDIELFVKLPRWFRVETPVGEYIPDWAIVKKDDKTLYLVRETKSTRDFLKLRSQEADKVRCGGKHFAALGVPFEVVTKSEDV
jgi:type III restriction enzyme